MYQQPSNSVCVRYVREKSTGALEVCEEFLGFCSIPTIGTEDITSAIVELSSACGLTMARLVGKGFDGPSNMSGHVSGVSARQCTGKRAPSKFQIFNPLPQPCSQFGHCCKLYNSVPDVRNFMETLKELTLFFNHSAKRKHILHDHFKSSAQEYFLADCVEDDLVPAKRKYQGIPVLSDTRRLTRVDSTDCLLKKQCVRLSREFGTARSSGQSASDADSFSSDWCRLNFL